MSLERHLRGRHGLVIPYLMAGVDEHWLDHVRAAADAGADAIEIGVPFSDPVLDGPVIQTAAVRALARGTTPESVARDLAHYRGDVPLIAMTYYNLAHDRGHTAFAHLLSDAGVTGAILPDLPIDESAEWEAAAVAADIAPILLAAPTTPDDRLAEICGRGHGFVYGVGQLGVTGERAILATTALPLARRLKAVADLPVVIGVGVSTPDNAAVLTGVADGVAVGAPVVRRVLDGGGAAAVADLVGAFRSAVDSGGQ